MNKERTKEGLIEHIVLECINSDYTDVYAAELMFTLVKEIMANEDNFPSEDDNNE